MDKNCSVVNTYKETATHYIGRGNVLGNPFSLEYYSLDESIANHSLYICYVFANVRSIRSVIEKLSKLSGVKLGCFCKPKKCHGDFIQRLIEDYSIITDMDYLQLLSHFNLTDFRIRMPPLPIDITALRTPVDTIMAVRDQLLNKSNTQFKSSIMAYIVMEKSHCVHHRIYSITASALLTDYNSFLYNKEKAMADLCNSLSSMYEYSNNGYLNAYSQSNDRLGYLLSNFANTPFDHPVHGHFESVEGWWYWYGRGNDETLRNMYGWSAKKYGNKLTITIKNDFVEQLESVLDCKIRTSKEILDLLEINKLPIVHYLNYGGSNVWPKRTEFILTLTKVLDSIKNIR